MFLSDANCDIRQLDCQRHQAGWLQSAKLARAGEARQDRSSSRLARESVRIGLAIPRKFFQSVQVSNAGEPAVSVDPKAFPRDVLVRDVGAPGEFDVDIHEGVNRKFSGSADGIFEELAIKFIADGRNVSALLRAENIPSSRISRSRRAI